MKGAALALKFFCELFAFAALGYWGATTGPVVANVILAVAAPLAAVFVWAQWCAPKAPKRLRNPALTVVEMAVFLIAAVAMFIALAPWLGVVFALVTAANARLLHKLGLGDA
jgi:hypothetical protein